MIELEKNEYSIVSSLLSEVEYYSPIAFSVVDGHQAGTVFVDDRTRPAQVLICGATNYNYLAGAGAGHSLPGELTSKDRPYSLCIHPQDWKTSIEAHFREQSKGFRMKTFRLDAERFSANRNWSEKVPKGCRMLRVDESLFDRIVNTYRPRLGFLWPRREKFLSEGLGYALLEGEQIASLCHTTFVGGGECDIALTTGPEYRRRGYATLTTAAFIDTWLSMGLVPQWHCTPDNAASIAIAARMGYQELGEFFMFSIDRD